MAAKLKAVPQRHMDERQIEDLEFEEALAELLDAKEDEEFKERLKGLSKAKRIVRDKCQHYLLQDKELLRCGRFVVQGKARNGGGFEVPAWESVIPGDISEQGSG
jgi:hypothetical protein